MFLCWCAEAVFLRVESSQKVDSRVSLLLSKQRSMETKATHTQRPFLPVVELIQLDLGKQRL